ncbi:PREDICTED: TBC1 domain family member 5 homolog A-like [Polistes dominula]|uniref:TBC1 domain family member 5 homolog A-like n=1 Tax=Polistes dominula TaxID=743375 RepID=A0ABM1J171_POLDO|nr:PREDICTED: TBC1 domain family member 5 homolog A-like [Polistes dominula]
MKKSPLSMPGGSRRQNDHQWKSYGDTRNTNCSNVDYKRGYYSFNNSGEMYQSDNGFIPLNNSTPIGKKQYTNNKHVSKFRRNHFNPGNNRFSYNNKPNIFSCTDPYLKYSPPVYKNSGYAHRRHNKNMNKDDHNQVDISDFIDMESVFEDPWAELEKKLENSNNVNASDGCSSISNIKASDNISFCDTDSQNNLENEQSQCQSIDARLEISDCGSKSIIDNFSDNKFDDTNLNLSSCNVSNDYNHAANEEDDKQDI